MTVGQIVEANEHRIISCDASATVEEAARLLADNRIGAMPVFDNGQLVGIFSERDLLYCIAREGHAVLASKVVDAMTAPAIVIDWETDVLKALALMTRRRIRHLPVTQGNDVKGFVSIGDLVKHRIELIEAEAEQMREYIQTA